MRYAGYEKIYKYFFPALSLESMDMKAVFPKVSEQAVKKLRPFYFQASKEMKKAKQNQIVNSVCNDIP